MVAGLVSCAKEASEQENMPQTGVPMTFNVTVLETKAAKADWADGDKIYVFFNGLETKYLMLERSSGGGAQRWPDLPDPLSTPYVMVLNGELTLFGGHTDGFLLSQSAWYLKDITRMSPAQWKGNQ